MSVAYVSFEVAQDLFEMSVVHIWDASSVTLLIERLKSLIERIEETDVRLIVAVLL